MVMAAIAGGVASSAASMASGAVKGHQQRKFAREQREWNLVQENSAYQRATADMRLAGLNPILAFGQGGKGSPAGSGAVSGATDPGGPAGLDIAASSALQATQRKQQGLLTAQTAKTVAETALIDAALPKEEIKSDFYQGLQTIIKAGVVPYSAKSRKDWAEAAMEEKAERLGPDFAGAKRRGAHKRHRFQIEAKRNYR